MYHVRCKECGWEHDSNEQTIKRFSQTCKHLDAAGRYRRYRAHSEWTNNRLRNIYQSMKSRCYDKNDKNFRFYGANEIKICDEWLSNPCLFEQWAFSHGYTDTLSIDRIDSNMDYSPENCRWIYPEDNARYKSTTRLISLDIGVSHSGREWAKILNLGTNTINSMLREYPEDKVKEFIYARLADKTVCRKSKQTWMDAYGIV